MSLLLLLLLIFLFFPYLFIFSFLLFMIASYFPKFLLSLFLYFFDSLYGYLILSCFLLLFQLFCILSILMYIFIQCHLTNAYHCSFVITYLIVFLHIIWLYFFAVAFMKPISLFICLFHVILSLFFNKLLLSILVFSLSHHPSITSYFANIICSFAYLFMFLNTFCCCDEAQNDSLHKP